MCQTHVNSCNWWQGLVLWHTCTWYMRQLCLTLSTAPMSGARARHCRLLARPVHLQWCLAQSVYIVDTDEYDFCLVVLSVSHNFMSFRCQENMTNIWPFCSWNFLNRHMSLVRWSKRREWISGAGNSARNVWLMTGRGGGGDVKQLGSELWLITLFGRLLSGWLVACLLVMQVADHHGQHLLWWEVRYTVIYSHSSGS